MKREKRNPTRERLEVYYLNLFLAYRPLLRWTGILLLLFSVAILAASTTAGSLVLLLAVLLVLLAHSFHAASYVARVCAWVGTVGRNC